MSIAIPIDKLTSNHAGTAGTNKRYEKEIAENA